MTTLATYMSLLTLLYPVGLYLEFQRTGQLYTPKGKATMLTVTCLNCVLAIVIALSQIACM